jgi:D-3-phosphoglycerate dehydrogenase
MNKGKVLIAAPVHDVLLQGLVAAGYEMVMQEHITQELAFTLVQDCVGIITSTRLQLNKDLLDTASKLRWIGRMGSGMEVVDVAYALQKNIACFSSPEGNCNAVAEHALGMLLALNKRIVVGHTEVSNGKWLRDANRGTELEGKTIGIIGFGHTGRAFAHKLSVFNMRILVYDKYCNDNFPSYVTCCDDLSPIYEQADIISFHVPLQADTKHYLDEVFINNMKTEFILVNTSRGAVVDSQSLLDGLLCGKVAGACLDVWEEEPLEKMSAEKLNILNRIILMPQG